MHYGKCQIQMFLDLDPLWGMKIRTSGLCGII